MVNNYEKVFCHDLATILQADLEIDKISSVMKGLVVRVHEKILYDITNQYYALGIFNPRFGFLEQDIVIGKPLKVTNNMGNLFYRAKSRDELLQPQIILEVKYGSVSTHNVIAYSSIAAKIKSIFPTCRYYLIIGYCPASIFEKVMRHGIHFDRIINLCARKVGQAKIPSYSKGKLKQDLATYNNHKTTYLNLVEQIKVDLQSLKFIYT
jgi:hypothetical protein